MARLPQTPLYILLFSFLTVLPSVVQATDLEITKEVDKPTSAVGDTLTFTLKVTNAVFDVDAAEVSVIDTFPIVGLFIISTSYQKFDTAGMVTESGSCSTGSQAVTCTLGTLPHDHEIIVIVKAIAQQVGSHVNTATVLQREGDEVNPENNTATIIFDVGERTTGADVEVEINNFRVPSTAQFPCPSGIEPGQTSAKGATLAYPLGAVNRGPEEALNVKVTHALPSFFDPTLPTDDVLTSGSLIKPGSLCNVHFGSIILFD